MLWLDIYLTLRILLVEFKFISFGNIISGTLYYLCSRIITISGVRLTINQFDNMNKENYYFLWYCRFRVARAWSASAQNTIISPAIPVDDR